MQKILPKEDCNLRFNKTITRWDEAIPLGNGLCGALIWGPSNGLRFSLDRGDIWDTTPFEGVSKEEFSYSMMVKLAKEGNVSEIRRIFDAPYNHVVPSKLPAGKLIFDFGCNENVCSGLDLSLAEVTIMISNDITLKSFLHAEKKIGIIKINKPLSEFSFWIENPQYSVKGEVTLDDMLVNSVNTASLKSLAYEKSEFVREGGVRFFVQEISDSFSYGIFLNVKEVEGETQIVYFVASSHDGMDWKEKAINMLKDALGEGYDVLLESHSNWWEEYWGKSSVTIPDRLFEKNWYLTQYLLASCSRKGCYPMPLQGVWTADDGKLPPWKGDYHLDLNMQMSYYSYLKANHLEEGESYINFLWDMVDCGREFAKKFYHSVGLCLPSVMTLTGDPLGGWGMYALSPTNQLWICQAFERHYRFSGDKEFLSKKAYPYLSETAVFILSLLEEREGLYYLPISSSPEIHDDNIESFLTPNSNYDLALMRYLFGTLIQLSEELQNGEREKWESVYIKLPALSVNEKGVLMLSPDEELEETHRHLSHAMSIHPLRLIPYKGEANCRIIDATILDLERLGTGYWVGYSYTWMAELYAIQGNGNGAAHQLRTFWNQHCSRNGFHLNGDYKKCGTSSLHYRPFTLEGNFCAADALQEMLLQSEDNILSLFPAVPEEWLEERITFDNFRGEKGLLVSAAMDQGVVTSLTLRPKYSGKIILQKSWNLESLLEKTDLEFTVKEDCLEIMLCGGKEYLLSTYR